MPLVDRVLAGDRLAVARLISGVEDGTPQAEAALKELYPHTGRAQVIGITGPAGSGKSTLTNELVKEYRRRDRSVGVIAVDPTSAITGGAILGDRVRMLRAYGDPGVFVRSMATRGRMGGLARSTRDVIRVLDASGKDVVVVETVGVGQDEVDIARSAYTTLLVSVPGLGDDIQAIKAGILEIADIMVLNKADREGANELLAQLRHTLSFSKPPEGAWRVPINQTVATTGQGIPELIDTIDKHQAHLHATGELQTRLRSSIEDELVTLVQEAVARRVRSSLPSPESALLVERVLARESDPFTAASTLLSEVCSGAVTTLHEVEN